MSRPVVREVPARAAKGAVSRDAWLAAPVPCAAPRPRRSPLVAVGAPQLPLQHVHVQLQLRPAEPEESEIRERD